METIFIFTACLLPSLLYVSVCILAFVHIKKHKDANETSNPKVLRDLAFLFLLIALSYASGCVYLLCGQDMEIKTIVDHVAVKLYLVSSVIPCILARRYACNGGCRQCFLIPAVVALFFLLITDVMFYSGHGEQAGPVLYRCAVVTVLLIFCFVVYISATSGSVSLSDGIRLGQEMQIHLLILSLYNFMMLGYSFGIHPVFDYVVLAVGFAVIHSVLFIVLLNGKTMYSLVKSATAGRDDVKAEEQKEEDAFAEEDHEEDFCDEYGYDMPEDGSLSLKDRLLGYFECEKPYLSKTLNMQEVAMRLFTNKSYLSRTINTEMNRNFREFVNYFRVKEAIKIFAANTDLSMAELMERSGFNNNASFTSAFKIHTGCTPGEWCRAIKSKMIYEDVRRKNNGKTH